MIPRTRLAQGGAASVRPLPLAGALALALLAAAPSAAAAAPSGPTFSVAPVAHGAKPWTVANARPGARIHRTIRVMNGGDAAGSVRLYAVDGTTGTTSGAVYRGEHEPRTDVGAWAALSRSRLRLAPGASRTVRLTITVPRAVRPGQHLGGVVAENVAVRRGRSVKRGRGNLRVDVRLLTISAVQVNIPGRRYQHLTLTTAKSGGVRGHQSVMVGMRNDGTEMVTARGSLVLSDNSGRRLMRSHLRLDTLVPETAIDYPVAVTGRALGAGSYTAAVVLHYGRHVARSTLPVSISQANVEKVFRSRPDLKPPAAATLGYESWLLGAGGLGLGLAAAAGGARLTRRRRSSALD